MVIAAPWDMAPWEDAVGGDGVRPSSPQNSPVGSLERLTNFGEVCGVESVLNRGSHMPGSVEVEKLLDYMRVAEAADYLGVSPNTLRNWVNAGKIAAIRRRCGSKKDILLYWG